MMDIKTPYDDDLKRRYEMRYELRSVATSSEILELEGSRTGYLKAITDIQPTLRALVGTAESAEREFNELNAFGQTGPVYANPLRKRIRTAITDAEKWLDWPWRARHYP